MGALFAGLLLAVLLIPNRCKRRLRISSDFVVLVVVVVAEVVGRLIIETAVADAADADAADVFMVLLKWLLRQNEWFL